ADAGPVVHDAIGQFVMDGLPEEFAGLLVEAHEHALVDAHRAAVLERHDVARVAGLAVVGRAVAAAARGTRATTVAGAAVYESADLGLPQHRLLVVVRPGLRELLEFLAQAGHVASGSAAEHGPRGRWRRYLRDRRGAGWKRKKPGKQRRE